MMRMVTAFAKALGIQVTAFIPMMWTTGLPNQSVMMLKEKSSKERSNIIMTLWAGKFAKL